MAGRRLRHRLRRGLFGGLPRPRVLSVPPQTAECLNAMNSNLLKISGLKKSFLAPDGTRQIIVDVPDFSLDAQIQIALAGESGSGKTTLLNLIAGILKPDAGMIQLDGVEISALSESRRDRL